MNKNISDMLNQYGIEKQRPDGSNYRCLLLHDESVIAMASGCDSKDVQIHALKMNIIPERYCRNQQYLSNSDQIKLLQSHAAVIGQGGLGGSVTEILARIGVGKLTLVDGDVFEESNLNRQLLSTVDNLGRQKAEAGKERVRRINPAVEVSAITEFLTADNAEGIIRNCNIAVDCLDSITARFTLEDACRLQQVPLVSAAIGGTSGQATVIFPDDEGLKKIYGPREKAGAKGAEAHMGTLPYAAILMAAVECAELVSIVCRNTSHLKNALLLANTDDHSYDTISLS